MEGSGTHAGYSQKSISTAVVDSKAHRYFCERVTRSVLPFGASAAFFLDADSFLVSDASFLDFLASDFS